MQQMLFSDAHDYLSVNYSLQMSAYDYTVFPSWRLGF